MIPLVAIHLDPSKGFRVTKIVRNGYEDMVIDDPEVLALVGKLWKRVIDGNFEGHVNIADVTHGLERGLKELESARAEVVKPLERLDWLVSELRSIHKRLLLLEEHVKERIISREDMKAWIEAALTTSPTSGRSPRGQ